MTDEMNGNGRWNLPEKLLEEGLSARIHVFFFFPFFLSSLTCSWASKSVSS